MCVNAFFLIVCIKSGSFSQFIVIVIVGGGGDGDNGSLFYKRSDSTILTKIHLFLYISSYNFHWPFFSHPYAPPFMHIHKFVWWDYKTKRNREKKKRERGKPHFVFAEICRERTKENIKRWRKLLFVLVHKIVNWNKQVKPETHKTLLSSAYETDAVNVWSHTRSRARTQSTHFTNVLTT